MIHFGHICQLRKMGRCVTTREIEDMNPSQRGWFILHFKNVSFLCKMGRWQPTTDSSLLQDHYPYLLSKDVCNPENIGNEDVVVA